MARLDWSRLHSKILRSSIWLEDPIVRLVWICALADSETDGTFYGSYEVLARAWNLPEADVSHAMSRLCAPDPKSSTKTNEGRRIIQDAPNSWRVLNKRLYNPSGEPVGASTPRVQKYRYKKRIETEATGNDSNAGNALEEIRLEEKRIEKSGRERFAPPTLEEVQRYIAEKGYTFDGEAFVAYYEARGWKLNGKPASSWKAMCVTWQKKEPPKVETVAVEDAKAAAIKAQADRDAEAQRLARKEIAQLERDRAEYQRLLDTNQTAAAAEFRAKIEARR